MRRNSFIYSVTRGLAQSIFSIFYRIEKNEDFIGQGPAIILPKHQYWTDIPITSFAFKPFLYFVAKKELFRLPLIRNYLSLLGGIPVDRRRSIRTLDSFKTILSLLKMGEKIVIFPEGTYCRDEVGTGKSRLLQMVLKLQPELNDPIPFVPVGIRYGERIGLRRHVEVRIGHPLFAEKGTGAVSLTHRVMEEISCLCCLPRQSHEFEDKRSEIQSSAFRTPNESRSTSS